MNPYFQDDACTIYLGDCREILPGLPKLDLVLTDPPYGIDFKHSGSHGRVNGQGVTTAARARGNWPIVGDDKPFDPQFLLTVGSEQIIWGVDHFFSKLPQSGRMLAWDKLDGMEAWDSFCDVEFAWHSVSSAARIFSFKWKGIACVKAGENNGLREHPTQKPIALMKWCIGLSRCAGVILDPFMGSGTTLRAAKDLGRKAIGIEIEERYCEIAAKRLSQKVLDFK